MHLKYIHICIIGVFLVLQSCVKDDLSKVSSDYIWDPGFSLPITTFTKNADNFQGGLPLVDAYKMLGTVIYTETIDFDFGDIFTKDEYIEQIMLRFDIINSFPAKLQIDAYYLDEHGRTIRSVIEDSPLLIESPEVDDEGNITSAKEIIHDEYFAKDQISTLLLTKQILIRIFINDLDTRPEVVDQINKFNIDINIGLRSAIEMPIDEV